MHYLWAKQKGFTIVELLIVIVVIGILAAITIVAYNGIQARARTALLQSSLNGAANLMQTANVTNGTYPTTIPSGLQISTQTGLSLSATGNPATFCVNAQLNNSGALTQMYYDSAIGQAQTGVCSGNVILGSETGTMGVNLVSSPDFSSGWVMNLSAGLLPMTTRPGNSGDPYPNKPVLVWNNNVAQSTSWSVLMAPVNYSQILSGKTYLADFWVRKTGSGYSGSANVFGVMDGNTANMALSTGAWLSVGTTWTKLSSASVAMANSVASNSLYVPVSNYFNTTGWTLEFQAFELFQQ